MYDWQNPEHAGGIPFAPEAEVEKIAENLLHAYGAKANQSPSPLDVDDLAQNHLGLRQIYLTLSPSRAYDGLLCIGDGAHICAYEPDTRKQRIVAINGRSMVIDSALLTDEPRYQMAVAHFCAHAVLHSGTALQIGPSDMPTSEHPYFLCRDTAQGTLLYPDSSARRSHIEQQASRFASALLMPRQAVYILTAGMDARDKRSVTHIINQMVEVFQVPRYSAENRLRELGVLFQSTG